MYAQIRITRSKRASVRHLAERLHTRRETILCSQLAQLTAVIHPPLGVVKEIKENRLFSG
ncbi:hypothetical protein RBSWK_05042 [Rhodopirellula baltica SWK14]|uniref:Uncharacterized protein n=1 Tax=Rhodopirellula baltica SWK14 TaxID=993516 RepID=L7CAL1_RHOBT|nr:hypothetical protein RBSWK_05042 [Rhodopirellula baltica SWK14]